VLPEANALANCPGKPAGCEPAAHWLYHTGMVGTAAPVLGCKAGCCWGYEMLAAPSLSP
jgi:hypothetical protein